MATTTSVRRDLKPGDRVRLELPYSEVCMYMRVAGTVRVVEITTNHYPSAQILNDDGSFFSFPIGLGEAAIYGSLRDGTDGLYAYEVQSPDQLAELARWEDEGGRVEVTS